MKNVFNAQLILLALVVCVAFPANAQIDTSRSRVGHYYFDRNDVVFEFDRRDYEKAMRASDGQLVDFGEIDLSKVAISGNFNNWSWEGWKMQKVDKDHFRLRKNVRDLKGEPNWQFKFVINGAYWVAPDPVKQGALLQYDLRNPDKRLKADPAGNAVFRLEGFTERKKVILAGNFNNWDEQSLSMNRTATGWELRLKLKPGVYEYKFIADGEWMHDPKNTDHVPNEHGTLNSVLHVTKSVQFVLKGYDDAQKVFLAGSFNDWAPQQLAMRRTESGWVLDFPLAGGKHLYKFVVDGQWILDPGNRHSETTWDGYENSVIMVR